MYPDSINALRIIYKIMPLKKKKSMNTFVATSTTTKSYMNDSKWLSLSPRTRFGRFFFCIVVVSNPLNFRQIYLNLVCNTKLSGTWHQLFGKCFYIFPVFFYTECEKKDFPRIMVQWFNAMRPRNLSLLIHLYTGLFTLTNTCTEYSVFTLSLEKLYG